MFQKVSDGDRYTAWQIYQKSLNCILKIWRHVNYNSTFFSKVHIFLNLEHISSGHMDPQSSQTWPDLRSPPPPCSGEHQAAPPSTLTSGPLRKPVEFMFSFPPIFFPLEMSYTFQALPISPVFRTTRLVGSSVGSLYHL